MRKQKSDLFKKLVENSIYKTPKNTNAKLALDKSALLADVGMVKNIFWLNVIGFLGLLKKHPSNPNLRKYIRTIDKVRIEHIDDNSHDLATSLKLANESKILTTTFTNEFTKLLYLLKTSSNISIDDQKIRDLLGKLVFTTVAPTDPYIKKIVMDFLESKNNLGDFGLTLFQAAVRLKVCEDFQIYYRLLASAKDESGDKKDPVAVAAVNAADASRKIVSAAPPPPPPPPPKKESNFEIFANTFKKVMEARVSYSEERNWIFAMSVIAYVAVRNGMRMDQLAAKIGVTATVFSRWMGLPSTPNGDQIRILMRIVAERNLDPIAASIYAFANLEVLKTAKITTLKDLEPDIVYSNPPKTDTERMADFLHVGINLLNSNASNEDMTIETFYKLNEKNNFHIFTRLDKKDVATKADAEISSIQDIKKKEYLGFMRFHYNVSYGYYYADSIERVWNSESIMYKAFFHMSHEDFKKRVLGPIAFKPDSFLFPLMMVGFPLKMYLDKGWTASIGDPIYEQLGKLLLSHNGPGGSFKLAVPVADNVLENLRHAVNKKLIDVEKIPYIDDDVKDSILPSRIDNLTEKEKAVRLVKSFIKDLDTRYSDFKRGNYSPSPGRLSELLNIFTEEEAIDVLVDSSEKANGGRQISDYAHSAYGERASIFLAYTKLMGFSAYSNKAAFDAAVALVKRNPGDKHDVMTLIHKMVYQQERAILAYEGVAEMIKNVDDDNRFYYYDDTKTMEFFDELTEHKPNLTFELLKEIMYFPTFNKNRAAFPLKGVVAWFNKNMTDDLVLKLLNINDYAISKNGSRSGQIPVISLSHIKTWFGMAANYSKDLIEKILESNFVESSDSFDELVKTHRNIHSTPGYIKNLLSLAIYAENQYPKFSNDVWNFVKTWQRRDAYIPDFANPKAFVMSTDFDGAIKIIEQFKTEKLTDKEEDRNIRFLMAGAVQQAARCIEILLTTNGDVDIANWDMVNERKNKLKDSIKICQTAGIDPVGIIIGKDGDSNTLLPGSLSQERSLALMTLYSLDLDDGKITPESTIPKSDIDRNPEYFLDSGMEKYLNYAKKNYRGFQIYKAIMQSPKVKALYDGKQLKTNTLTTKFKIGEMVFNVKNNPSIPEKEKDKIINETVDIFMNGKNNRDRRGNIAVGLLTDEIATNSMKNIGNTGLVPITTAISESKIIEILKFNNFEPDIAGLNVKRYSLGGSILKFLESNKHITNAVPEAKVSKNEDMNTEMALKIKTAELAAKCNGLHGDIGAKVLEILEVDLMNDELKKWSEERKDTLISPVYHGTGSIAASMILRFGFKVMKSSVGGVAVVGKMLGNGIYCSPVVDKASQYLGDSGYSRNKGVIGYLLEMDVYLGTQSYDYKSAGGSGRDNIRSLEYCVFNPRKQIHIRRALKVELVSKAEIDAIIADVKSDQEPPPDVAAESVELNRFTKFIKEDITLSRNMFTFIFHDGTVPTESGNIVDFDVFLKEYEGNPNIGVGYGQDGPEIWVNSRMSNEMGIIHVPDTEEMVSNDPESIHTQWKSVLRNL